MKKLFFALAMMLVGTFAFANSEVTSNIDVKDSIVMNDSVVTSSVFIVDDICTITVIVTFSNGDRYSATASNNQGDCDAAREAARDHAYLIAAVFGGHSTPTIN
jgi:hypothetical protein